MDEQSFARLIAEHQGIIHKVCGIYTRNREDRRDLFQEIVLQLWRSVGAFRGDSKVSTWMYRVALNTAISGFRKDSRRPPSEELSESFFQIPATESDPEFEEKRTLLYKAIQMLNDIEKAVVMLHLEEKSYEEIAEIAGITSNHVGVLLNRIRTKLRKLMTPGFS